MPKGENNSFEFTGKTYGLFLEWKPIIAESLSILSTSTAEDEPLRTEARVQLRRFIVESAEVEVDRLQRRGMVDFIKMQNPNGDADFRNSALGLEMFPEPTIDIRVLTQQGVL